MDFFSSQDHARRKTKLLLVLFVLAVLSIILLTNLLLIVVASFGNTAAMAQGGVRYSWETFLLVSLVVVGVVGLGSVYRVLSLAKGGEAVADMMGGKLLLEPGDDLRKRRLLNIVEEMAIASGTPVPPVYVIADDAINAFAAGFSPSDAVIGITEGAINNLDRDQLQGVIAHEFSHILNGDMRLNIRLMGVLFGIVMLAVIGRIILSPGRISRRDGGAAIALAGLGLFVLGYLGKFFGTLIKAAVSRQREFLADASAVQFTRNPQGIAGALKRIGGYSPGSVVADGHSEEISHAFFAEGVKFRFASLTSTHPPLDVRIRRIDPRWDGNFQSGPPTPVPESEAAALTSGFVAGGSSSTAHALDDIGHPKPEQLDLARGLIAAIPARLSEAAHEPCSARALVYLVLLDTDPLVRSRQIDHLAESADPFVFSRFQALLQDHGSVAPGMRLPLIEMALPALRQLSRDQYARVKDNIAALIRADNRVGLSEWALQKYLTRNLEAALEGRPPVLKQLNLPQLGNECGVLLSMLAYADASTHGEPERAFDAGRGALGLAITLAPKNQLALGRLNEAVDRLARLHPLQKPKLLKACIATVAADQVVVAVEEELVRAIADALDCPMPPLRPTGSIDAE